MAFAWLMIGSLVSVRWEFAESVVVHVGEECVLRYWFVKLSSSDGILWSRSGQQVGPFGGCLPGNLCGWRRGMH